MSERKAGWYWVKLEGEWRVSEYRPGHIRGGDGADAPWSFGILLSLEETVLEEIGPRIPTPDEPWQCVPADPTEEIGKAGEERFGNPHDCNGADCMDMYRAMLKAAPRP